MIYITLTTRLLLSLAISASCARLPEDASAPSHTATRPTAHVRPTPTTPVMDSVVPQVMSETTTTTGAHSDSLTRLTPEVTIKPASVGLVADAVDIDDWRGESGEGNKDGDSDENMAEDEDNDDEENDYETEYYDDSYDDGDFEYDIENYDDDRSNEDEYDDDYDEVYSDNNIIYEQDNDIDGEYNGYILNYWEKEDNNETHNEDTYVEMMEGGDEKQNQLKDSDAGMVYMYLQGNDSTLITPFFLGGHKDPKQDILLGGEGLLPPSPLLTYLSWLKLG
ncbi:transcriptional regulator IFH1-like [Homarus americanus]|uniref:transcriptional regulator IFH1-like n=1 Tax=Homarus americanus TaxID=6706 RepID=UPI001C478E52|nr:transcriptional regulator IFH1-like [Homarus americanus]